MGILQKVFQVTQPLYHAISSSTRHWLQSPARESSGVKPDAAIFPQRKPFQTALPVNVSSHSTHSRLPALLLEGWLWPVAFCSPPYRPYLSLTNSPNARSHTVGSVAPIVSPWYRACHTHAPHLCIARQIVPSHIQ